MNTLCIPIPAFITLLHRPPRKACGIRSEPFRAHQERVPHALSSFCLKLKDESLATPPCFVFVLLHQGLPYSISSASASTFLSTRTGGWIHVRGILQHHFNFTPIAGVQKQEDEGICGVDLTCISHTVESFPPSKAVQYSKVQYSSSFGLNNMTVQIFDLSLVLDVFIVPFKGPNCHN